MSRPSIPADGLLPDFHSVSATRLRRWRHIKDVTTRHLMGIGGVSVIVAILLIAFYLVYVVLPLFSPARLDQIAEYPVPAGAGTETLYYAMEEQHEIGMRVTGDGKAVFFRTLDGGLVHQKFLVADAPAEVTAFAAGDPSQTAFALGLADGTAILAKHVYKLTYPQDVRVINPDVTFPQGAAPIVIDPKQQMLRLLSVQSDGDQATFAAVTEDNRVLLVNLKEEKSFLSDEATLTRTESEIGVPNLVSHLALDVEQRELYVADAAGFIYFYDIGNKRSPRLVQRVTAVTGGARITSLQFLAGGISILVGDSTGRISQWFPVRDEDNNYTLGKIRHFDSQNAPITDLAPEYFRKGFLATDDAGNLGIYHTTAHRTLKVQHIDTARLQRLAVAPRANALLAQTADGTLHYWNVHNEHPEVSWQSLWGKVWYESRQKPEFIWQSSSASSDFEPKFSLTPLAFGTLKASFYALIFAVPLGILAAIYTGYFMSPGMRNIVKPSIEIMAALPTVILGFLAGLWFAPFAESNMPAVFAGLILVPLSIVLAAWCWSRLPERVRLRVPDGCEAALLMPVIILVIWFCYLIGQPLEVMFFDGNMPHWITNELGIDYSQRNSLVVGLAMGFAVIPTIFSISEDAIYGVPKHLTTGSLALGATPWQTMARVVLLTASPGIFSAVMIGLGRAVGETMIVLMATGNTAVMDMNIFEGFRALSANIAVEMPESEVGGTHYRILFLAGLVLFMATFLVNTAAEIVRQRLRNKYSSL